jgi:hypothetical protein
MRNVVSSTHSVRKGSDLCSTDSPRAAKRPTTWRQIQRIRNDRPARPIDPAAEPRHPHLSTASKARKLSTFLPPEVPVAHTNAIDKSSRRDSHPLVPGCRPDPVLGKVGSRSYR